VGKPGLRKNEMAYYHANDSAKVKIECPICGNVLEAGFANVTKPIAKESP
jgi:hypothetical protein